MDFSQDSKKVVDASTGRDPVEHSKRSARELGLPPIIQSGTYIGLGRQSRPRKPRKERPERSGG